MSFVITEAFTDKLYQYCAKYDRDELQFSLHATGHMAFLKCCEYHIVTRIGSNMVRKIGETFIGQNETELSEETKKSDEERELLIKDLESALILDTDIENESEEERKKSANMTYALSGMFATKLHELRIKADYLTSDLSLDIIRSNGYISHLENKVTRSIYKRDFYNLTMCLAISLMGSDEYKTQEDVIAYFMPYMRENPKKLRRAAEVFFEDENSEVNEAEMLQNQKVILHEDFEKNPLYNNLYDAICELVSSKETKEEQEALMKKLLRNLLYPDYSFISDIFSQNYTEFVSSKARDQFILELNQLIDKYSL